MDSGICLCGSGWFVLRGETGQQGVICIDEFGNITGYTGDIVCVECGEVWEPFQRHLRLVEDTHDEIP